MRFLIALAPTKQCTTLINKDTPIVVGFLWFYRDYSSFPINFDWSLSHSKSQVNHLNKSFPLAHYLRKIFWSEGVFKYRSWFLLRLRSAPRTNIAYGWIQLHGVSRTKFFGHLSTERWNKIQYLGRYLMFHRMSWALLRLLPPTWALLSLAATSLAVLLLRNSTQPSVKFLDNLSRRLDFSFKSGEKIDHLRQSL